MATHQEAGAPKETPAAPQDWLAQEEARAKGKIVEQERQNALDSKMQELERDREGLHSFLYRAGSAYNAILNERSREIDQRDYLGVVNHVQKAVKDAGLNVPADYAENLILARLAKDAELRQAFEDRNKSAQHAKQFGKLVKQNKRVQYPRPGRIRHSLKVPRLRLTGKLSLNTCGALQRTCLHLRGPRTTGQ